MDINLDLDQQEFWEDDQASQRELWEELVEESMGISVATSGSDENAGDVHKSDSSPAESLGTSTSIEERIYNYCKNCCHCDFYEEQQDRNPYAFYCDRGYNCKTIENFLNFPGDCPEFYSVNDMIRKIREQIGDFEKYERLLEEQAQDDRSGRR